MFGRDRNPDQEALSLAVLVGELKARLAHVETRLEGIERRALAPSPVNESMLSDRLVAVIASISRGNRDLARHLESEARRMKAEKTPDDEIVVSLNAGTR